MKINIKEMCKAEVVQNAAQAQVRYVVSEYGTGSCRDYYGNRRLFWSGN